MILYAHEEEVYALMNTELPPSFDQDVFQTNKKIILAICDTLSTGIQVLKAVRNTSDAIIDFEYVLANKVYTSYAGIEDPTGKSFLAIHPGQLIDFNRLVKIMNNEKAGNVIHSLTANDIPRWLHDSYILFQDGVVVLSKDISGQLKMEEEIKELNMALAFKNRQLVALNSELYTFTNVAANDYKETLRNLYTGLEYIASHEAGNLTDTGRANVRRAQASIQKMKLLTEDIITYSTIPSVDGSLSLVDMNLLLESVKNDIAGKVGNENIQIEYDDLPPIYGYTALLSLLFHHLIDNSVKFRKDNTALVIHIRCSEVKGSSIVNLSAQKDIKYKVISVTDNGNGFDPKHAQDIFTIFYRIPEKVRRRGSGIGLAICKKIMDMHGGFMMAESIPGDGATFHCYFPIEKE